MTTATNAMNALAVRYCIVVCLRHGWWPDTDTAARLVALQEAIIRGRYREGVPAPADQRLEFGRYLVDTGRISEL